VPIPRSLFDASAPTDHDLVVVEGTWPVDLAGELVLSAPHPDTFGGPHPFFGEGMTYRLSLRPGTYGAPADGFAWRQRRIESPSARLRARRPDVFQATMIGVQSPFGATNAANTAPLPWGDRLFMTWDVGRPVEVDPVSLGFLGEVGHRSEWIGAEIYPQPLLPLVFSTAHPVIDPDRELLWTVNTLFGQLNVVCWDGNGPLRSWPVAGATIPQSVHSITQTRDWLVVGDCAFKVEPQVIFGGDRTEPANHEGPLYLIRKDALLATPPGQEVAAQRFDIAPEINHYYATYDDSDGVQVLFEHTENADIAMTQGDGDLDALGRPCDPALRGLYGFPMSPDRTSLVHFDPERGTVAHRAELRDPKLLWTRQLNAMDWSTEGRTRPTSHHFVCHGWRPEAITQKMLGLYGDRVDRSLWPTGETPPLVATMAMPDLGLTGHHELGLDDFPTSPIFVPRDPGADATHSRHAGSDPGGHDGYVVVPIMNDDGFRVEAYDAADVSRGPVATLRAPGMTVPFVLHSAWMPSVAAPTSHERVRFSDELDRVDELPDDLAQVARQVARDLDDATIA
jgi:all-trans-8'-apo-beta-carotenal 15,15'-oxygenase